MTLFSIESPTWGDQYPASIQDATVDALEGGSIIVFPNLAFRLEPDELKFLNPGAVHGAKNVSFNPATGKVGGTKVEGPAREQLQALLNRFSRTTAALVRALLTPYASGLQQGRASLRPVEIAGRASSWRADDTRLHVDAFPSQPVRDKRILRVFTNINPAGQPRTWKVGGSFDDVARRFHHSLRAPAWGRHVGLYLVRMTKQVRTPYDHYMLQLHDLAKADAAFQRASPQAEVDFAPGTTWVVFSDQVLHAAMGGQHMMEQTFYLPPEGLRHPHTSPLAVLERLTGRRLSGGAAAETATLA